jgi:hypothetical protein
MAASKHIPIVVAISLPLLAATLVGAVLIGLERLALAAPSAIPRIGPSVSIWSDTIDNGEPVVAYNMVRDEYLVVWEDYNASDIALYGQLVGSDGLQVGSRIQIMNCNTYTCTHPAVAYSPVLDQYLVVFTQDSKPSLPPYHEYNLIARMVDGDGTLGQAFNVDAAAPEQTWRPAVAYNSQDDEFLVVWEIEHGPYGSPGLRSDIYARRVYSDASLGRQVTDKRCVVTGDPGSGGDGRNRVEPAVAYHEGHNQYLIAYTREGAPDLDVLGKLAAANLDGVFGSSEIAICTQSYDQSAVAVAASPDEYLAVWQDEDSAGALDVRGRRIRGSDGLPLGSASGFLINHFLLADSFAPEVAYAPVYGFMLAFQTDDGGNWQDDVHGNHIHLGQETTAGDPFFVDGGMGSSQRQPDVACAPYGDCLFVDADDALGSGDYEIDGQFMLAYRVYLPLTLRNS